MGLSQNGKRGNLPMHPLRCVKVTARDDKTQKNNKCVDTCFAPERGCSGIGGWALAACLVCRAAEAGVFVILRKPVMFEQGAFCWSLLRFLQGYFLVINRATLMKLIGGRRT